MGEIGAQGLTGVTVAYLLEYSLYLHIHLCVCFRVCWNKIHSYISGQGGDDTHSETLSAELVCFEVEQLYNGTQDIPTKSSFPTLPVHEMVSLSNKVLYVHTYVL